ncbi:MAG: glycosyltransferase family 4 protein [Verrucomicrobiaceae bacterium]|nr:glycosyltransferase family 4 protein [Verrucomicrobiaceae bacterium]
MKLALIYHQFIRSGGLEGYLLEFASRLAKAGHELTHVTARITPDVREKLSGKVVELPRIAGSPLLRMWQFARESAKLAPSLPVDASIGFGRTFAHDLHRAGGGCHGLYSRLLPWYKRYAAKNLLELHLERTLYTRQQTRHFVTNSNRVSAQLQGMYHPPATRFTTIHTAVDTALFRPAENRHALREVMCRKLQTPSDADVLLFVSLSHRRKGLDALLEGLAQTKRGILWIVGKPLTGAYKTKIAKLGLDARVRQVPVTGSIMELYQAADWFVHPTLYDACANTVLQSMASGLPGIISAQDGAIDHIQDGRNGFMLHHPADPKAVASRIDEALSLSEPERKALGDAARDTMLPFTWDNHVQKWEELIPTITPWP